MILAIVIISGILGLFFIHYIQKTADEIMEKKRKEKLNNASQVASIDVKTEILELREEVSNLDEKFNRSEELYKELETLQRTIGYLASSGRRVIPNEPTLQPHFNTFYPDVAYKKYLQATSSVFGVKVNTKRKKTRVISSSTDPQVSGLDSSKSEVQKPEKAIQAY